MPLDKIIIQESDRETLKFRQQVSISAKYKALLQQWNKEDKAPEDDEDGYYSPKLVRLLLKYYYALADGYVPFGGHNECVPQTTIGNKTRFINPIPYFEEAIIWKSDIDEAISKLKSNGDVNLPWQKICMSTDEKTVKQYLPFLDPEQKIIVEQFILEEYKSSGASVIFKKLVLLMNGMASQIE